MLFETVCQVAEAALELLDLLPASTCKYWEYSHTPPQQAAQVIGPQYSTAVGFTTTCSDTDSLTIILSVLWKLT